jgi:hypothetical protein
MQHRNPLAPRVDIAMNSTRSLRTASTITLATSADSARCATAASSDALEARWPAAALSSSCSVLRTAEMVAEGSTRHRDSNQPRRGIAVYTRSMNPENSCK